MFTNSSYRTVINSLLLLVTFNEVYLHLAIHNSLLYQRKLKQIEINIGVNVQFNHQKGYLTNTAMWFWSSQSADIPTLENPECIRINNVSY
jgi:hypothetical protein